MLYIDLIKYLYEKTDGFFSLKEIKLMVDETWDRPTYLIVNCVMDYMRHVKGTED